MRKMTVSISWHPVFSRLIAGYFSSIESIEILEVLKEETGKGYSVGISRIAMRETHSLEDIPESGYFTILEILNTQNRESVCLVRVTMPERFFSLMRHLRTEIIWEKPILMTQDMVRFSCCGSEESLRNIEKFAHLLGKITTISYENADYRGYETFKNLSQREREVLQAALRQGYYEYPRKITATELSARLHTSKSTTIEFLRRAENKIMAAMVERNL